jgi:AraC-like DNA-binding protein/TolB-like protein
MPAVKASLFQGTSPMDGIEQTVLREPDGQRLLPQHVKRALAYMRANVAERITLAGLASVCAMPERTLLRQFQRFVGVPPLGYLRRLRLNIAKSELAIPHNNDAIVDIAIRCGFSHVGCFATEYRRLFGETPSATRQRVRARTADAALANVSCFGDSPPSPLLATTREKPSLLILPLRTETLRENLEARDLTERLAATLSRMRIASVALAHPSRAYSAITPQPRNAGAQYCLLGRLMHQGERVRVIVRLVDAATDRHVWGDSFDGSVSEAFAFQDRVVDGVLCGVVSRITDAEIQRAHSKDPRDVSARDLALQALPLMLQANLPSVQSAIAIIDRAIDTDPADATAIAFLAYCHAQRRNYIATTSLAADRQAALDLSERAGMLDNSDALVLTARGAVAASAQRNDEAEALAVRALSIDPTCAWAWMLRGHTRHGFAGAPERAIADYQRSIQLRGPGISTSSCIYSIGAAHWNAGRFEETVRWVRRALAENPNATWMHRHLSCAAAKLGDRVTVAHSVDCMRRAQPHLTVSLLVENYPIADPDWLEAISRAGMPL